LDVDDVSVEGFRTYYFRVSRTVFAGWGSVKLGNNALLRRSRMFIARRF